MSNMGRAPEVLQAMTRQIAENVELPKPEIVADSTKVPVTEIIPEDVEILEDKESTTEESEADDDNVPPTPPEVISADSLEILPDKDIDKLCEIKLAKVDRRWGRDTKINKLKIRGISAKDLPPTPPV